MEGIHTWKSALARHEAAPLLCERESYLAHLQQLGTGRRRLTVIAAMLLQVVRHLGLTEAKQVTREQVATAGTAWCNATEHRRPPMAGPHSRRTFEGTARQFLRFTGLLLELPPTTNQFSELLQVYLDETARERRLSIATRDTARLRLRRFFAWLASRRTSLADVKIEDIDDYLDFKRQSCTLRTLCSEAATLQDFSVLRSAMNGVRAIFIRRSRLGTYARNCSAVVRLLYPMQVERAGDQFVEVITTPYPVVQTMNRKGEAKVLKTRHLTVFPASATGE